MTKLYAEVYKLKQAAVQGLKIAQTYGQQDAVVKWETRILAYETVLGLLGDPEIATSWWKKLLCKLGHVKHNSDCPVCGGWM